MNEEQTLVRARGLRKEYGSGEGLLRAVDAVDLEQMLAVMLVALAVLNALFTTWAMVLDARRAAALMRALGARARQVTSGLVIAHVLAALPGAILGIRSASACSGPR